VLSGEADANKLFDPLLPTLTLDQLHNLFFFDCPQLSGLVWLESMHVLRMLSHFLCWHPNLVATGSPTEHVFQTPFPKSDLAESNHHASVAYVLGSGRIGQVWESAIFLPKWCKMAKWCQNGKWHVHRALDSHILHSLTIYDICTRYVWLKLAMGRVCGQQSKLAMFVGVQWWGQRQELTLRCTIKVMSC